MGLFCVDHILYQSPPWGFWSQHSRQCIPRRKCSPGEQDAGFSDDVMCSCAHFKHVLSSQEAAASSMPTPCLLYGAHGWERAPSRSCVHRFSQPCKLGDQTVHFLINKQNVIQRCQELFSMHSDLGLPRVSGPAYPLPIPWQSFHQAGAPRVQSCSLSFPVPAQEGPRPSPES